MFDYAGYKISISAKFFSRINFLIKFVMPEKFKNFITNKMWAAPEKIQKK